MLKRYPIWIAILLLSILFIILWWLSGWDHTFLNNLLSGLPTEVIGIVITLINFY